MRCCFLQHSDWYNDDCMYAMPNHLLKLLSLAVGLVQVDAVPGFEVGNSLMIRVNCQMGYYALTCLALKIAGELHSKLGCRSTCGGVLVCPGGFETF